MPVNYNDGSKIEMSKFLQTRKELARRFTGCTFITGASGTWVDPNDGVEYDDVNRIFYVDAPNTPETIEYFRAYKEELKARFQQKEIKITTFEIAEI